jgi:hypothetical protein
MNNEINNLRTRLEEKHRKQMIIAQLNKVSKRLDELSQVKTWHELQKQRQLEEARKAFDFKSYVRSRIKGN